jgi:hypothetical protein
MENHSYEGSMDQLWNSTAMVGVHSYGKPQLRTWIQDANATIASLNTASGVR